MRQDQSAEDPTRCPARGRRRRPSNARGLARSHQHPARDVCPRRQRLLEPDHEAFVDWFVAYWRQRGARVVAGQTIEQADA
jgi:hypothetical protein